MKRITDFVGTLAVAALLGCVSFLAEGETASVAPAINARVRAALQADLGSAARHIRVESFGGTIQLSGSVDSQPMRERALRVAGDVDGVNHVENALGQSQTSATSRALIEVMGR